MADTCRKTPSRGHTSIGFPWKVTGAHTVFPTLECEIPGGNQFIVRYESEPFEKPAGFVVLHNGCYVFGPGDLQEAIDFAELRIRSQVERDLTGAQNRVAALNAFARQVGI